MSNQTATIVPIDPASQTPEPPARKRGAQPGNHNAFRHGFYAANLCQRSFSLDDSRELHSLLGEIAMIKDFMYFVYEKNKDSDDPKVLAASLRALALGGLSITRLLLNAGMVRIGDSSNSSMSTLIASLKSFA